MVVDVAGLQQPSNRLSVDAGLFKAFPNGTGFRSFFWLTFAARELVVTGKVSPCSAQSYQVLPGRPNYSDPRSDFLAHSSRFLTVMKFLDTRRRPGAGRLGNLSRFRRTAIGIRYGVSIQVFAQLVLGHKADTMAIVRIDNVATGHRLLA